MLLFVCVIALMFGPDDSKRSRRRTLREDSSTGYGLRFSTDVYGSKQKTTVFHTYLQEACRVLT